MQNSDTSPRRSLRGLNAATGNISAAEIDPGQPHSFSPHLRWCERPDGTFVLEAASIEPPFPSVWQEVALWKTTDKTPSDEPAPVAGQRECEECGKPAFGVLNLCSSCIVEYQTEQG